MARGCGAVCILLCSRHAAPLVPFLQEHEGELIVVATGPLTNIALAMKLDEQFASKGAVVQLHWRDWAAGNMQGAAPSPPRLPSSPQCAALL